MLLQTVIRLGVSDVINAPQECIRHAKIINLDHTALSVEENAMVVARKNSDTKSALVKLANNGFYHYKSSSGVSSYVRHDIIKDVWHRIKEGDFKVWNDMVYSISKPLINAEPRRLFVIFSSINNDIYTSGMLRHFTQNFTKAQKHIPQDAAILRIADLGGVVGAYYLNTNFLTDNEKNVQALIDLVRCQLGISRDSTVLYGASKGGTGALYHSLVGGYGCVAVDPIVSDDYYLNKKRDLHFTKGVFPRTKEDIFSEILKQSPSGAHPCYVICSERSPQFKYINDILEENDTQARIRFFNSVCPTISDHPDVSPSTLNIAGMLINMLYYDMRPSTERWRTVI